jgi:hypothetical protein
MLRPNPSVNVRVCGRETDECTSICNVHMQGLRPSHTLASTSSVTLIHSPRELTRLANSPWHRFDGKQAIGHDHRSAPVCAGVSSHWMGLEYHLGVRSPSPPSPRSSHNKSLLTAPNEHLLTVLLTVVGHPLSSHSCVMLQYQRQHVLVVIFSLLFCCGKAIC